MSAFFRWLSQTHAMRWRVAHRNVGYGHLYQGRFKNFTVQEEHLLTVLRFVERSALSARLVTRAEDWRWSSLWTRKNGDRAIKAILSPWPVRRPANWIARVNTPMSATELGRLRASVERGRPFGDGRLGGADGQRAETGTHDPPAGPAAQTSRTGGLNEGSGRIRLFPHDRETGYDRPSRQDRQDAQERNSPSGAAPPGFIGRTTTMRETTRTFIAIPIPEPIGKKLARWQQALTPEIPGCRWTESDSLPFHITLAFLGDVPNRDLNELCLAVAAAVEPFGRFELKVEGLGAFPSPERPRVVWAGITADDLGPLMTLREAVVRAATRGRIPARRSAVPSPCHPGPDQVRPRTALRPDRAGPPRAAPGPPARSRSSRS